MQEFGYILDDNDTGAFFPLPMFVKCHISVCSCFVTAFEVKDIFFIFIFLFPRSISCILLQISLWHGI